jgi:sugar O-acyltransferase (sialic acid O-acetyltransferase NeuD family)
LGGGEHACVVADVVVQSASHVIEGYADPRPDAPLGRWPHLRQFTRDEDAVSHARETSAALFVAMGGFGNGRVRQRIARAAESVGGAFPVLLHPRAVVSPHSTIAQGTVVMAQAVIQPFASLGIHCIVNTAVVVEHHVTVGDYVHLAPGVVVGGGATIGDFAAIGIGARVRDHVRIGAGATIGMGAVVTGDVPEAGRVVGHPARPWTA